MAAKTRKIVWEKKITEVMVDKSNRMRIKRTWSTKGTITLREKNKKIAAELDEKYPRPSIIYIFMH